MKAKQNALALSQAERDYAGYPEEQNWLNEKRGMERTKFAQQQEEFPFKKEEEALDFISKWGSMVNSRNYPDVRMRLIQRGVNPQILPPIESFGGDENKFNAWLEKSLTTVDQKIKQREIGVKERHVGVEEKKLELPETKSKTPEQLTAGELKEELGRDPTNKEIKERIKKEAKGYDTAEEAFAEAQRMHAKAGDKAGLIPSYELSAQNKYVPKLLPNIEVRIPPFRQGQNLPPGIVFNNKTGKYSDTTTGKEFDRKELINLYGINAAINADKMALGELTKREQLIKVFTNRIDANVPIVLDAVKEVGNKNPRLLNEAINKGQQYLVGSGKWQALQTAMLSLSNEVQRLESNTLGIGGQGQEERRVWAKIHDPNMTFNDIKILASMIQKLSKTATGVIEKQRSDLIKRIPIEGIGNEPTTPEIPPSPGKTTDIESLRRKYNY
jgi:hypothetical protein